MNDDLLMAKDLSSLKPRGAKRISPPPIIRPKSTSEESGDNMWSNDFVDHDEFNPEGQQDYLEKEDQVPFTSNEQGTTTYEAGYMSTVSYEPPQQQQLEMEILKPVRGHHFQKQSAAPKPISTPAAPVFHKQSAVPKPIASPAPPQFKKQSGVQKTVQQKSIAEPVVTKGHVAPVESNTITTRGSQQKSCSNHAAPKGHSQNLNGFERLSQQKSDSAKNKQSGNEKKSNEVSTSLTTSTSGGARGVEKIKDIIDPENMATHSFFYGMKFVELNCSLNFIQFSDGNLFI